MHLTAWIDGRKVVSVILHASICDSSTSLESSFCRSDIDPYQLGFRDRRHLGRLATHQACW